MRLSFRESHLNEVYDAMITQADWELQGLDYLDRRWRAMNRVYNQVRVEETALWWGDQVIECQDCHGLDMALEGVQHWGEWLDEFCRPDYSGMGGDLDMEFVLYQLDSEQRDLNRWYPVV